MSESVSSRVSIGRDAAIALAATEWWKLGTPESVVRRQLFTAELCMPFGEFHKALESVLKRPVFTHEFGMNYDGLVREFLGVGSAPTMREIIYMIPADKRIVVQA